MHVLINYNMHDHGNQRLNRKLTVIHMDQRYDEWRDGPKCWQMQEDCCSVKERSIFLHSGPELGVIR